MEGNARIWFTPKQKAELWERWKGGQCVERTSRAHLRGGTRAASASGLGSQWRHCLRAPRRRALVTLRA